MRHTLILIATLAFLSGCSTSFQGIKIRAEAPSIEEAYRKLSLAVSVDEYTMSFVDPAAYRLTTDWREAKAKERSDIDVGFKQDEMQSRIELKLEGRGKLYDVLVTPWIRYKMPEGNWKEVVAGVRHPLREKWEKAVSSLVRKESKEED